VEVGGYSIIFKKCHIQSVGPHTYTTETVQHTAVTAKLRKALNEENITL